MDINEIIAEIQKNCIACKWGKALIALKELEVEPLAEERNKITHKEQGKCSAASQPVTSGNGRKPAIKNSQDAKSRTEKACHKCNRILPLAEYPKNRTCADGHSWVCKQCVAEQHRREYHARRKSEAASHAPEPQPDRKPEASEKTHKKHECETCHATFHLRSSLIDHERMRHGAQA